jgi:hypothetical protein
MLSSKCLERGTDGGRGNGGSINEVATELISLVNKVAIATGWSGIGIRASEGWRGIRGEEVVGDTTGEVGKVFCFTDGRQIGTLVVLSQEGVGSTATGCDRGAHWNTMALANEWTDGRVAAGNVLDRVSDNIDLSGIGRIHSVGRPARGTSVEHPWVEEGTPSQGQGDEGEGNDGLDGQQHTIIPCS